MPQLNLVLHGTWAIELNETNIYLVTVPDEHHVIKAGDRDNPSFDLAKYDLPHHYLAQDMSAQHESAQQEPAQPKLYRLKNVKAGNPQSFDPRWNVIVDKYAVKAYDPELQWPLTLNLDQVEVLIEIPYPMEIHSVRRGQTNGELFENDFPPTPEEIAVVQVLVYDVDVEDLFEVYLITIPEDEKDIPEDEKEKVYLVEIGSRLDPAKKLIDVHVFASPDDESHLPGDHFRTVFQKLGNAYGLVMTPLTMLDIPLQLEEPILGLGWRDTVSLHELRNRPAASPTNCNMVVIDKLKT